MAHQLRSRRMALLASAVVLGLTACGAPAGEPVSTEGGPAPLQLVAGGGVAMSGSGANESMDASPDVAKMMMPAFIEYVYAGDVPDLTAPAGSWFFPAGASATAEQVQRLAAAFGITDAVEAIPVDQGGGWRVGPADWSGPSVQVTSDGMLSWSFSPGPMEGTVEPCVVVDPPVLEAEPSTDAGAADVVTAPDTVPVTDTATGEGTISTDVAPAPVCPEPTPPTGVPDAATAEARARELFAAVGLDLSTYELEVYADEWGAYVTATLRLDGVRTWLSANIGFGAEGAITWAGGFLGQPQRGDDYPRIGVEAAVARLNDQSSMWMYPMMSGVAMADGAVAASGAGGGGVVGEIGAPEESAALPPVPDPGLAPEPVPMGSTVVEPLPVEPPPIDTTPIDTMPIDTMPIVVTLTSPTPSLEMFWATDGTIWLLPGYQFATSDGGTISVLAVPDEYVEQVDPGSVDTVTVTAPPVEPVPVDTVGETPPLTLDEAAAIVVGLSEADAAVAAAGAGIEMRVVEIDGVPQPVTEDFRIARYNVAVDGGVVTAVLSNG